MTKKAKLDSRDLKGDGQKVLKNRAFGKYVKTGNLEKLTWYENGVRTNYKYDDIYDIKIDKSGKKRYYQKYEQVDMETGEIIKEKGKEIKVGRANSVNTSSLVKYANRMKNLNRSKNKIKDIINANVYEYKDEKGKLYSPKFLTLTFAENVTDIQVAYDELKKFMKRLNDYLRKNIVKNYEGIKYLSVIEFQERGAVHFHMMLFNMPFIISEKLADVWGNGFIKIQGFVNKKTGKVIEVTIDEKGCVNFDMQQVKNVGAYITKTMDYMQKTLQDSRLDEQRAWSTSRGIKKPIQFYDYDEEFTEHISNLNEDNIVWVSSYFNEYLGNIDYIEYNIFSEEMKFDFGNNADAIPWVKKIFGESHIKIIEGVKENGKIKIDWEPLY